MRQTDIRGMDMPRSDILIRLRRIGKVHFRFLCTAGLACRDMASWTILNVNPTGRYQQCIIFNTSLTPRQTDLLTPSNTQLSATSDQLHPEDSQSKLTAGLQCALPWSTIALSLCMGTLLLIMLSKTAMEFFLQHYTSECAGVAEQQQSLPPPGGES